MALRQEFSYQQYLDDIFNRPACNWCKDPVKAVMPKTGLCKRCNTVRLDVAKRQREFDASTPRSEGEAFDRQWKLDIAKKKIDVLKRDGHRYGDINKDEMSQGMALEHEFSRVSTLAVGQDLFYGKAGVFEHIPADVQRFIYFMLSSISREHTRKNVANMAMGQHQLDSGMIEHTVSSEPSGPIGVPLQEGEVFRDEDKE